MQLDVTVRDNITIVRRMEQESKATAGQLQIQIKPNINYQYSQKLTIQLYYSRTDLRPYTSGSFRNVNTQFGVKMVFQLN